MKPIPATFCLKNYYVIERKTCTNNTDFGAIALSEALVHMCFTE